jgi:hypothetical protein
VRLTWYIAPFGIAIGRSSDTVLRAASSMMDERISFAIRLKRGKSALPVTAAPP